jgi:tRNA threonylcarbamoyladenosine biosynthesis protein TsaB
VNVLAIDGALGAFSAAIAHDGEIRSARSESGQVALERGLHLIGELLSGEQLRVEEIDRFAVGIGPGSFTSLRIAITYAKSIAAAIGRPLVALSSFDLLEFGSSHDSALAVVVGRPGVISARYRDGAQIRRASGRPDEVLAELFPVRMEGPLPVVGAPKDVLDALAERGTIVQVFLPAVEPAAAAAALAAFTHAPSASVHAVRADYGELPAARPPKG